MFSLLAVIFMLGAYVSFADYIVWPSDSEVRVSQPVTVKWSVSSGSSRTIGDSVAAFESTKNNKLAGIENTDGAAEGEVTFTFMRAGKYFFKYLDNEFNEKWIGEVSLSVK